ncbi:1-pyrroline-5-carboxylate dehydrogenase [Arachidicoccus ginsenosidimutans]|uniref:L-glutamate gamma-semialdehyde dehydrogenase n=1 Tax=Arachidicoccus sp. BS20 TaxID=1850526 RepID=UPI0007F0A68F|nr:L-glutamate gamma-semialdehyde dehydrogenase [Arachidicoccus sp. BS20]ANI88084.1 1-pyrroline-5-carboxylate dehydrogenase [Arachidicoccus sp. BS20]
MSIGYFNYKQPANEPVLNYAPGSPEKIALKKAIAEAKKKPIDIPLYIGGKAVKTNNKVEIRPPHEIKHLLGTFHMGDEKHVQQAIDTALKAKASWETMPWEDRAHIFLKAADLISTKYRAQLNAATMLCQSKNAYQAEIDSACELIDFLRFNVHFLNEIYQQQPPATAAGIHNRTEWRSLEGFVLAITPFNFTAISANLPSSAAMCGNVVVWKPADTQVYAAQLVMRIFKEAGLPDGVINLIYVPGDALGNVCFSHPDFAGIHFTGSSAVFNHIWKEIGTNISKYKSFPRIVGETGGKDFVLIHKSADVDVAVTALARGAFEYQGQKCSAASRAYIPSNLADKIKEKLIAAIKTFKVGPVEDFTNFVNAVIDERSFDKIARYIDNAKKDKKAKILVGGTYDKSEGYFIQPTVIEAKDPKYVTMCEEIFGPVLTVYVYDENKFEEILETVNSTSPYALTGAIISQDREAIALATDKLRHAAGNFYVNDKPTGAVVGQQPFGGARASGTNDKAGSALNLYRWLSARTIKETFVPPTDYKYPFLAEE